MSLLLLLPPPPELSLIAFRAAYGPALSEILGGAAPRPLVSRGDTLDIAICCQDTPPGGAPWRGIYPFSQRAIALLYRLICSLTAIGTGAGDDLDVRIVILNEGAQHGPNLGCALFQGPILTLGGLATSPRPWLRIYTTNNEAADNILNRFTSIRNAIPTAIRAPFETAKLPGGAGIRIVPIKSKVETPATSDTRHFSVLVGGTFDHLHAGHKLLLTATALVLEPSIAAASSQERSLTVGITGDELLKNKKYADVMESWEDRENAVCRFLCAILSFEDLQKAIKGSERFSHPGPNGRAIHHRLACGLTIKCVEISDPFGPAITDESITALVVSGETRAGGKAVNDKRMEKRWPTLEVFEVDVLDSRSGDDADTSDLREFQSKISSTEIRRRLHNG